MNKVLGKVDGVNFGYEDHGILTLYVDFHKEDGFHQSFGGYCLDSYDKKTEKRVGTAAGLDYIIQIMRVFGTRNLNDIVGKPAYCLHESNNQKIVGIESPRFETGEKFLIDNWRQQWFPETSKEDF